MTVSLKQRFQGISQIIIEHLRQPLFANAYALMFNTGFTSGLGIVYWWLAAHLYNADVVGQNSSVISTMILIATLAQINLNSTLTRFVPRGGRFTKRLILGSYATAIGFAILLSIGFLVLAKLLNQTNFPTSDPVFDIWFVVSSAVWVIFVLQDSVLVGIRRTPIMMWENGIYSVVKVAMLLMFGMLTFRYGLLISWTVPPLILIIPVNYLILRRYRPWETFPIKTGIETPEPPPKFDFLVKYILSDYVGAVFALLATQTLPLLVIHFLGTQANAYFYIGWIIANSLDLVTGGMGWSLMVEGAHDRETIERNTRAAIQQVSRLMIPTVAILVLFTPILLSIFGAAYVQESTWLLRLLLLTVWARMLSTLYLYAARIESRFVLIVVVQASACIMTIGLSIILLPIVGITGVGIAWFTAQTIVTLGILIFRRFGMRPRTLITVTDPA